MAKFVFDGQKLKSGGKTIANVSRDKVREGSGARIVCNITGDKIRDGAGAKIMFNIKGDKICQGSDASVIAKMRDVDKEIDGPGGTVKAALWLYFVR